MQVQSCRGASDPKTLDRCHRSTIPLHKLARHKDRAPLYCAASPRTVRIGRYSWRLARSSDIAVQATNCAPEKRRLQILLSNLLSNRPAPGQFPANSQQIPAILNTAKIPGGGCCRGVDPFE